jgi:hypothetical protein
MDILTHMLSQVGMNFIAFNAVHYIFYRRPKNKLYNSRLSQRRNKNCFQKIISQDWIRAFIASTQIIWGWARSQASLSPLLQVRTSMQPSSQLSLCELLTTSSKLFSARSSHLWAPYTVQRSTSQFWVVTYHIGISFLQRTYTGNHWKLLDNSLITSILSS